MIKVLVICAGLQFGGVERFSANICIYAPKDEFKVDYLTFEGLGDAYVPEIESAGGCVFTIPSPSRGYKEYVKALGDLIDKNHYDVVHSHTQFNSGINMWVAKKHNVPVRLSHSHTTAHEQKISVGQKVYEQIMRMIICKYSTKYLACGLDAGKWMYNNHPFTIIKNGIDTKKYSYSLVAREKIRKQLSIPDDAFVIGHSGTLSKLKNQEFLIRLLPEVKKKKPNTFLLLLGTGNEEIKDFLVSVANECDVSDSVKLVGAVMNVNEYLSAFDVFAFPSLREGTPLALLEAQANGLPCVISDAIPADAKITNLIKCLPLSDLSGWKNNILSAHRENSQQYAKEVEDAGFDMRSAYNKLYDIYRSK